MRVLITGVGGFVGSSLARYLVARGFEVSGTYVDQLPTVTGITVYEADLLDRRALERAVAAADPQVVVNLAGLAHVGESWKRMPEYFQVNVLGTENLLDAAKGRRVVIASSAEVYGLVPDEEQPLNEDRPVAPRTPYALTKAAAERLALGAGAIVTRSFNMIGAHQAATFALPAFARQLAAISRGEVPPVLRVGNLGARRDFLHVDDGAAAYLLLAQSGQPGMIYNLASGVAHSLSDALQVLLEVTGLDVRIEPDPERMRPLDLPLLLGDAHRLRTLGWQPERSLRQALVDLWEEVQDGAPPAPQRESHPRGAAPSPTP
jgi:GDP-4-dehydro-6-deoxy-D-mannose reductase